MKHRWSILCLGLFILLLGLAQVAEIHKLEGHPTITWTIPVVLPSVAAIAAAQSETSADNTAVISTQSRGEEILPRPLVMLLLAVVLIVSATYLNALLSKIPPFWHGLGNALAIVLLVYGILMLTGLAAGGRDPLHPLRGVDLLAGNPAGVQHLTFKPIKTVADLERELAQADGRAVMLDFYADWCVSCKEMEKYTFSDPQVQAALGDTILLQADVTANDDQDQALLSHFGLIGPPAILFFDANGVERPAFRVVGFMAADDFREHLELALRPVISSIFPPLRRSS